jgi:hypothetical protein
MTIIRALKNQPKQLNVLAPKERAILVKDEQGSPE